LPEVVARIHRAGARAYVTMNTLVFEPELEHCERVLRALAASGVDALIVQDPAVCLLARAVGTSFELHASTQMTICNADAARFAQELGCTRVVVPREFSVAEIARMADETDVELEVFVHGALCVSWSGQCLTSEAWGGRSANRGQCAQSCRMPYSLVVDGKAQDLGDVRYLLSPKDLAGARAVPELAAIGVHGLKIEGRQKGPQYVATATAGYRRWVDAIAAGTDRAQAERQLAQDLLAMSLSYTRGFSDGFLAGSDHQTLVEGRFPKHRGVYLGTVARCGGGAVAVRRDDRGRPWTGAMVDGVARAAGPQGERSAPLATAVAAAPLQVRAGMGVVFDQGTPETEEPGGPVFAVEERAGELWLSFGRPGPDLTRVRVGDRVWVTNDGALAAQAERLAGEREPAGRVALALRVAGAVGEPLRVDAATGACAATVTSAVRLEPARGRGLDAELLRDKLGAFGGTPFRLAELDCAGLAAGLHLPPGELKELRRRLCAELLPAVERGPVREHDPRPALPRVRAALAARGGDRAAVAAPAIVPLLRSDAQLVAAIELGCGEVELDWMEFTGLGQACERARRHGLRVVVATPRIGKPGEEPIDERLLRLEPDGVLLRHWGAVMRWRRALPLARPCALHGDFSLNVTNALTAAHVLALGLDTVTASFDLDEAQLQALLAAAPRARVAVVVHHRIPTFHTEHCMYSHLLSNGRDYRSCGRPCERHRIAVRDHQQREHPVIVDVGCRNTIFHHEPQQAADWLPHLLQAGVQRFRIEFVREDRAQTTAVLAAWQDLLAGRIAADALAARTGAVAQIGVAQGRMRLLHE
jgi:putative protease